MYTGGGLCIHYSTTTSTWKGGWQQGQGVRGGGQYHRHYEVGFAKKIPKEIQKKIEKRISCSSCKRSAGRRCRRWRRCAGCASRRTAGTEKFIKNENKLKKKDVTKREHRIPSPVSSTRHVLQLIHKNEKKTRKTFCVIVSIFVRERR